MGYNKFSGSFFLSNKFKGKGNFFSAKKYWFKKNCEKYFWVQNLGQKNLGQKNLGSKKLGKKILGQKKFGVKKYLVQKNFWVIFFFVEKFFVKYFVSKIFFFNPIFGLKNFLGPKVFRNQENFLVHKIFG